MGMNIRMHCQWPPINFSFRHFLYQLPPPHRHPYDHSYHFHGIHRIHFELQELIYLRQHIEVYLIHFSVVYANIILFKREFQKFHNN